MLEEQVHRIGSYVLAAHKFYLGGGLRLLVRQGIDLTVTPSKKEWCEHKGWDLPWFLGSDLEAEIWRWGVKNVCGLKAIFTVHLILLSCPFSLLKSTVGCNPACWQLALGALPVCLTAWTLTDVFSL